MSSNETRNLVATFRKHAKALREGTGDAIQHGAGIHLVKMQLHEGGRGAIANLLDVEKLTLDLAAEEDAKGHTGEAANYRDMAASVRAAIRCGVWQK